MLLTKVANVVLAILILLVVLLSYRFAFMPAQDAFPVMLEHLAARPTAFWLHVVASPIALLVGFVQFRPKIRARWPQVHRWTGRVYVAAIVIGGIAALSLAWGRMPERPIAGAGFGLLGVLWVGVTLIALQHALARDFRAHRIWMIRSYALTLAAVTLRLQLPWLEALGMSYAEASAVVAWSCWVPNLAIAQWFVSRLQKIAGAA